MGFVVELNFLVLFSSLESVRVCARACRDKHTGKQAAKPVQCQKDICQTFQEARWATADSLASIIVCSSWLGEAAKALCL